MVSLASNCEKSISSMSRCELQHPFTKRISSFLPYRMSWFILRIYRRNTYSAYPTHSRGRHNESPNVHGAQIYPHQ